MWNKQVNDMENVMGKMKVCLLVLSALLILVLVPVVSAEEQITKITYISYTPNEALEMASETNDYSNLIEYTFINYYNATSNGISDEILEAAETGFLETQDVIVCDHIGSTILNDLVINETMRNAHDSGTELYTIKTMGTPPEYFDYISDGSANDPICNYCNNLGTEGEGLESAENLLLYLTMKNKVTYISYTPNEALEMASETNDYSNLIEYTFINYYNATSNGISDEILEAAETGFLETQDVIVCDHIGSTILGSVLNFMTHT